jgi:hypothetical protein
VAAEAVCANGDKESEKIDDGRHTMASFFHAARLWEAICKRFIGSATSPPSEDVIHEFFVYGSQYYLAGRYGMFAGLMPVAANLHHHGIEMMLKGALSKTMSLENLKSKLMHNLPRIWKKFKEQANDPSLSRFDKVIKELSKFNDVRYPDKILRRGAAMMFDITRAAQNSVTGSVANVPQYKLCLEDIDEVVSVIFKVASRNPHDYLRFLKQEARDFLSRDNAFFR